MRDSERFERFQTIPKKPAWSNSAGARARFVFGERRLSSSTEEFDYVVVGDYCMYGLPGLLSPLKCYNFFGVDYLSRVMPHYLGELMAFQVKRTSFLILLSMWVTAMLTIMSFISEGETEFLVRAGKL